MATQDLEVKEKKELQEEKGEKTEMGRYYSPDTDIYETEDALHVTMDVPGVGKDNIEVNLDKNSLTITGKIDVAVYDDLKPVYTEYNVGNYTRSFSLSSQIDKSSISASIDHGVLTLTLPKAKEAAARKINVN